MAKRISLTGKTFGEWEVISYAGDKKWNCRCSCGNEVAVDSDRLRSGSSKSCGHNTTSFKDMIGMEFGEWTVISLDKAGYWNCSCSCGTLRSVSGYHIRAGRTKSCGHNNTGFAGEQYIENNVKLDDKSLESIHVGDIIGEWEVLERQEKSYWLCRCSCEKEALVTSWDLRTGKSKSCGHSQIERLEGKTFGEWEVLKYLGKSYWECKCSCGEVRKVKKTDLINGKSRSCGHHRLGLRTDLSGHKYGMLKVKEYRGNCKYLCECDCGAIKEILSTNLINGGTTSCGCKHSTRYTKDYLEELITKYIKLKGRVPFISDLADTLELHAGSINKLLHKHSLTDKIDRSFRSRYEREIWDYIKDLDPNIGIIIGDKSILNGYEIDIYLPSKRTAIEFNRNFWHSSLNKTRLYHQKKTLSCFKNQIQLIHIFEYEWLNYSTQNKLKNIIKSKILYGSQNRIYARKCTIKPVSKEAEANFLNEYHLQNKATSSAAYGLYSGEELLSIMTFGKPRFNSEHEIELIRYCNKHDISIVGGAERLFKHAIKELKPKSLITYCDISKFSGNVYTRLNFTATSKDITNPNYKWVDVYTREITEVLSRHQTQKNKLIEQGYGIYGSTEDEIMTNRGYTKIHDSGNLRLIWKSDKQ